MKQLSLQKNGRQVTKKIFRAGALKEEYFNDWHKASISRSEFRFGKSCLARFNTIICKKDVMHQTINIVFIDHEKAFKTVDRNKFWAKLQVYGIHNMLMNFCINALKVMIY